MMGGLGKWIPAPVLAWLSERLPKRIGVYNGVAVRDVPFYRHDRQPHKKEQLWQATKATMQPGDLVTFIGGGKGIVPVKAAYRDVDVMVIEAAREYVIELEQTAGLNAVDIDVVHGLVGEAHDVWGDYSEAERIPPEDIPGDVVVLDCEGAEREILPLPNQRVVLETHPAFGVTESKARELLTGTVESHGRDSQGGKLLVQT